MAGIKVASGLLVLAVAAAAGCGGSGSDPAGVTRDFCEAVRSGGAKAAKPYLTRESRTLVDKGVTMTLSGEYTLGKVADDGRTAKVTVIDPGSDLEFQTVLVREDAKWRVDLEKTLTSMLGSDVGDRLRALR